MDQINFIEQYKKAMSCFPTGVSIVMTDDSSEIVGVTINSLTSVSLNPCLLLIDFFLVRIKPKLIAKS